MAEDRKKQEVRETKIYRSFKSEKTNAVADIFKMVAQVLLAFLSAFAILAKDIYNDTENRKWLVIVFVVLISIMVLSFIAAQFLRFKYDKEFHIFQRKTVGDKINVHVKKLIRLTKALSKRTCNSYKIAKKRIRTIQNTVISGDQSMKVYQEAKQDKKFSREDNRIVIQTIKDIDHVLLSAVLLNERIELGSFIEKTSDNALEVLTAKIDMLGWTYSLKGQPGNCSSAINSAQRMMVQLENDGVVPDLTKPLNEEQQNFAVEYYILKSRSYRHLAASTVLRRNIEDYGLDQIREANKCLDELNKIDKLTESQTKKIYRNRIGIAFGYIESLYDHALMQYRKKDTQACNTLELAAKCFLIFLGDIKPDSQDEFTFTCDIKEIEKLDKHRYIKTLFIINKMIFLINNLYRENEPMKQFTKKFKELYENNVKDNLQIVKENVNSSIYVDEAVETYIQQKVEQSYLDVLAYNKGMKEDK